MSLKINYLDKKKSLHNNRAIFIYSNIKISGFQGDFDDQIKHKIQNFLKTSKNLKDNKIIALNEDFDKKLIIIFVGNASNELESEKLGAKFFDFVKQNEVNNIYIKAPLDNDIINFNSFIHGAELKSYEFNF